MVNVLANLFVDDPTFNVLFVVGTKLLSMDMVPAELVIVLALEVTAFIRLKRNVSDPKEMVLSTAGNKLVAKLITPEKDVNCSDEPTRKFWISCVVTNKEDRLFQRLVLLPNSNVLSVSGSTLAFTRTRVPVQGLILFVCSAPVAFKVGALTALVALTVGVLTALDAFNVGQLIALLVISVGVITWTLPVIKSATTSSK